MYFGATVFALTLLFANSETLKRSLIRTEAYSRFVPAVIEENARANRAGGSLSLEDPAVAGIIVQSFHAESLQHNTEQIIDSFYRWLNGQTDKPDYVIDLSENIDAMAQQLSELAMSRLEQQPICDVQPIAIDPLADTCRPEFYDYQQGRISLAEQIRAENGVFSKLQYSVDDLPKNQNGQTIVEQYHYAPQVYRFAKQAHWILLCLAAIGALLVVYASRRKRVALSYLGTALMGSGVFLAVTPLFYLYILPRIFGSSAPGVNGSSTTAVVEDVINVLVKNLNVLLVQIGLLLTILGLAVYLFEWTTRPKSKYLKSDKKAGVESSEQPRRRRTKLYAKPALIPVQTSEGPRRTGKYQKDKKYRKIPKKEL